jgi:nucleotide-binding universal stress UspA family protein
MINKVMVPLDGSPLAEQVLPLAAAIAWRGGADLLLVRVIPMPQAPLRVDGPTLSVAEQVERATWEVQQYLAAIKHQVFEDLASLSSESPRDRIKIDIETTVGLPGIVLPDFAQEQGADLIVMATHGRTGLDRWARGSVADKVIQLSRVPIIAMRPGATGMLSIKRLPRLDRIMVTLDGSGLAETVLPLASRLARRLEAELVLFRVVRLPSLVQTTGPNGAMIETDLWGDLDDEAQRYMQRVAESLTREGVRVQTMLAHDDIAGSILATADTLDVDLIAMSTHGRTGLNRLVFGSIADRVLRASHRPVLIIRPPMD